MNQSWAVQPVLMFGLAFDVEKDPTRKSGFKPARSSHVGDIDLFADLRLEGFASLLRLGISPLLTIVGGDEARYSGETPTINRAWAIREMLIHDCGIAPELVEWVSSLGNTGGNIAIIRDMITKRCEDPRRCVVATSGYHLCRVICDLNEINLPIRLVPTEAFWLLEDEGRKSELIARLGGGPLAKRMAEEMLGIAHKLRGTYKPLTP